MDIDDLGKAKRLFADLDILKGKMTTAILTHNALDVQSRSIYRVELKGVNVEDINVPAAFVKEMVKKTVDHYVYLIAQTELEIELL